MSDATRNLSDRRGSGTQGAPAASITPAAAAQQTATAAATRAVAASTLSPRGAAWPRLPSSPSVTHLGADTPGPAGGAAEAAACGQEPAAAPSLGAAPAAPSPSGAAAGPEPAEHAPGISRAEVKELFAGLCAELRTSLGVAGLAGAKLVQQDELSFSGSDASSEHSSLTQGQLEGEMARHGFPGFVSSNPHAIASAQRFITEQQPRLFARGAMRSVSTAWVELTDNGKHCKGTMAARLRHLESTCYYQYNNVESLRNILAQLAADRDEDCEIFAALAAIHNSMLEVYKLDNLERHLITVQTQAKSPDATEFDRANAVYLTHCADACATPPADAPAECIRWTKEFRKQAAGADMRHLARVGVAGRANGSGTPRERGDDEPRRPRKRGSKGRGERGREGTRDGGYESEPRREPRRERERGPSQQRERESSHQREREPPRQRERQQRDSRGDKPAAPQRGRNGGGGGGGGHGGAGGRDGGGGGARNHADHDRRKRGEPSRQGKTASARGRGAVDTSGSDSDGGY